MLPLQPPVVAAVAVVAAAEVVAVSKPSPKPLPRRPSKVPSPHFLSKARTKNRTQER
jgi:hypothetical protein